MLKVEWDSWWATLPALEARESLQLYRALFVADAGRRIDNRQEYLDEWEDLAEGSLAMRLPHGQPRRVGEDISLEVRSLFGWIQEQWGPKSPAIADDVDARDGFSGEVVSAR